MSQVEVLIAPTFQWTSLSVSIRSLSIGTPNDYEAVFVVKNSLDGNWAV